MKKSMKNFIILFLLAELCFSCLTGEYRSTDGTCLQCDISCLTCSSRDGCDSCYDQMYLIAKANLIVCQVCYRVNEGCDICITAKKCSNCLPGYFLQTDSTCSICASYIPNCLLCENNGNNTICNSCAKNYRLNNSECQYVSNIPNIQARNISSSTNVAQNSPISNFNCDSSQINLNGNCYPTIAFCLTYSQVNGSCISCNSLFVLSNGYCLPSNFITTNTNNQATSLSKQNIPASSNSNVPTQTPINPSNSANSESENCTQFDPADPTKCLICANGYTTLDSIPGVCYRNT